ncbi:hypothetical protein [Flavobacterium ginsenosidimutans]|uniref:hypothetical protein n=1 Tax=Flavobacterium ginsenosidimutans TaxID=687844 RepID=UPI000DAB7A6C|nr:hypothetical protein [Flavobacterium ginsenosidimutans]KAF2328706.1 hypothetical protein DM444_16685 [Flavobacterium ginsenosidimutans]
MISAVCTLFEGHYHYGVATLSNSLYTQGFRGTIYVGYRGSLPNWISNGKKEPVGNWKEAITIHPVEGIELVFLPLATTYSLTNYKPDLMLELWDGPAKEADALFYFDPDIVVVDSWACFEQWVNCGVAVCEDINSPLQEFHPRRQGWRNYFKNYNIDLQFKNQIYVNGGFVGVIRKNIFFLKLWVKLQERMGDAIGGLDKSIFQNQMHNSSILKMEGFQFFDKSDQDALNATIEAYHGNVSYLGKDGMGFIPGEATMFHALGSSKPWQVNHFIRLFKGRIPRKEDVAYWEYTKSPILAHSKQEIRKKQMAIKISKFLGRFYKV